MPKNKEALRIVFMGTPHFSAEIFSALLDDGYNIVGAFTQPDKKVGRKKILEKSPVKVVAEKNNIPIFSPHRLDQAAIEEIKSLHPDVIVLAAYGKILPQAVLDLPKLGAVNIHPSLLPKFRGPSPIQNALLKGEVISGTTIMLMDSGMDTGDILKQESIEILPKETYFELEKKMIELSGKLLLETLPRLIAGKITPQEQNDKQASYCKLIKKEDGQIDWNDSAENIYNSYRAFIKWPGIFTYYRSNGSQKRLKLNKINLAGFDDASSARKPGEVFELESAVYVQTKTGAIRIEEVQLEGRPAMRITDFKNGQKNFIGSLLG